jgi:hypothetical protein
MSQRQKTDYVGDVDPAIRRLDRLCPRFAESRMGTGDQWPCRYHVVLWNLFGKWDASEPTLAESVHVAIDRATIDNFGFPSGEGPEDNT